jgi:hypothetical protein
MNSRSDLSTQVSIAPSESASQDRPLQVVEENPEESVDYDPAPNAANSNSSIGSKSGLNKFFKFQESNGNWEGFCIICPSHKGRVPIKMPNHGTSGLWSHLRIKHRPQFTELKPEVVRPKQRQLDVNALVPKVAPSYDADRSMELLLKFFVAENLAFNKAQSEPFRQFVMSLNGRFKLPSPNKLKEELTTTYNQRREQLKAHFNNHQHRVSLTFDGWTSPNGLSIIGITAHFLSSKWEYNNVLLSFAHLESNHTGARLAREIERVCVEFGLEDKIYSITSDNASANDAASEELVRGNVLSWNPDNRIRCFAHVVNLVALVCHKIVSKQFKNVSREEMEPESSRVAHEEAALIVTIEENIPANIYSAEKEALRRSERVKYKTDAYSLFESQAKHGKRRAFQPSADLASLVLGPENSLTLTEEEEHLHEDPLQALSKLRDIVNFFRASPLRRQQLALSQSDTEFELVLDVPTRWNSTLHMIKRANLIKPAIELALKELRDSPDPLSQEEWDFLSCQTELLSIFEKPTLEVSKDPSFLSVIHPLTINILKNLSLFSPKYKELSQAKAAAISKLKLYWERTKSPVYYYATLLDPRCKFNFYRSKCDQGLLAETEIDHVEYLLSALREYCNNHKDQGNKRMKPVFADDDVFGTMQTDDENEVDSFLSLPIQSSQSDPLQWWHLYSKERDSRLSELAMNIFGCQASSVASERAFSVARDIITDKRNRLSRESIHELLCCKSWFGNETIFHS